VAELERLVDHDRGLQANLVPNALLATLARTYGCPELDFAYGLGTLSLLHGDVVPDSDSLRPVDGNLSVPGIPPAPDPALLDTYE
jgi:O-succinylbenzoate synthase